jgi:hypothetical protein
VDVDIDVDVGCHVSDEVDCFHVSGNTNVCVIVDDVGISRGKVNPFELRLSFEVDQWMRMMMRSLITNVRVIDVYPFH